MLPHQQRIIRPDEKRSKYIHFFYLLLCLYLMLLPSKSFQVRTVSSYLHRHHRFTATQMLSSSSEEPSRSLVIIIAGPTAVGKSRIAQALADRLGGATLLSADSVQVYSNVTIGANKPPQPERETTLLMDLVDDATTPYSAGDWRRDAMYALELVTGKRSTTTHPTTPEIALRHERIDAALQRVRDKQPQQPLVPIVVGGTMMYLQWLVHGQPDAARPTPEAVQQAQEAVTQLEETAKTHQLPWSETIAHVQETLQHREDVSRALAQLEKNDWYRVRRLLEVAYTPSNNDNPSALNGLRTGGLLHDPRFDVRCFFLCPTDRMTHAKVMDERCEDMLAAGLFPEVVTAPLPAMVTKAIGYRQCLTYLQHGKRRDASALQECLAEFAGATRRYAKKQMQWFRRDAAFWFVPVSTTNGTVDALVRCVEMPRAEYDAALQNSTSESAQTRAMNEAQGKGMKFYLYKPSRYAPGSAAFEELLEIANECAEQLQQQQPAQVSSSWHLDMGTAAVDRCG